MLKTKEIEIEEYKFKIQELDTKTALSLSSIENKEQVAIKLINKALIEPKPTDEFLSNLPAKIGIRLMMEINQLCGLDVDFQSKPEK